MCYRSQFVVDFHLLICPICHQTFQGKFIPKIRVGDSKKSSLFVLMTDKKLTDHLFRSKNLNSGHNMVM